MPNTKRKPAFESLSKHRLEFLIEQAVENADEPEDQTAGFLAMFESNLELPFKTKRNGVELTVSHLDISYADCGAILATFESGNQHSIMDILDVPIPNDHPPEGWEWIEAYRYWVSKRRSA